jgi:hypothetical protein
VDCRSDDNLGHNRARELSRVDGAYRDPPDLVTLLGRNTTKAELQGNVVRTDPERLKEVRTSWGKRGSPRTMRKVPTESVTVVESVSVGWEVKPLQKLHDVERDVDRTTLSLAKPGAPSNRR